MRHIGLDGRAAAAVATEAVRSEFEYARLGLVTGVILVLLGVLLCLNGIAGKTQLMAKLPLSQINVNDAVPGVILFALGAIVMMWTKPDVKLDHVGKK